MLATAGIACLHSLVAVQALVLCAFITPNQDLAFVLAVSYDVLSSLLAGVWVHIGNMVSLFTHSPSSKTHVMQLTSHQLRPTTSCLQREALHRLYPCFVPAWRASSTVNNVQGLCNAISMPCIGYAIFMTQKSTLSI